MQCAERALGGTGELSAKTISVVGRVRSQFPLGGQGIQQGGTESNCKKILKVKVKQILCREYD